MPQGGAAQLHLQAPPSLDNSRMCKAAFNSQQEKLGSHFFIIGESIFLFTYVNTHKTFNYDSVRAVIQFNNEPIQTLACEL